MIRAQHTASETASHPDLEGAVGTVRPTGSTEAEKTYRQQSAPGLSAVPVAFPVSGGPQCFARARDFTRETLRRWSLDHCCDDTVTVVTELTANAVTHALPYAPVGTDGIWLGLAVGPGHVLCAVADPVDRPPVVRHSGDDVLEEHGRGLHLIDALSRRWGWTRNSPTGKTVWALLPAPRRG
ncbi:ATP-binding protein [Streptomyces poonensis]|uniref:ATP-binding protein n=1 Tax=Streptomyces poonensis TaxID=68255 RepID=UPI001E3B8476|nr:ATP-binding protein [Streptomyces poonensis]